MPPHSSQSPADALRRCSPLSKFLHTPWRGLPALPALAQPQPLSSESTEWVVTPRPAARASRGMSPCKTVASEPSGDQAGTSLWGPRPRPSGQLEKQQDCHCPLGQ